MDRAGLIAALGRPRCVALSRRTREAAAVLAGLRVAVSDQARAADRDRGPRKSWLADLWASSASWRRRARSMWSLTCRLSKPQTTAEDATESAKVGR